MAVDWKKGASLALIQDAKSAIMTGFRWSGTEEGTKYWETVHDKLWKMSTDLQADMVVQKLSGDTGD